MNLKIEAIVPAAGLGLRLKSRIPKPLVLVRGDTLITRTLELLSRHPDIFKIIVLAHRKNLTAIKREIRINNIGKIKCVAEGGLTRRQSVEAGLKFLDKDTDFVLIHDAARPFVDSEIISNVIKRARKSGAAVCGVPLKPTIKTIKLACRQVKESKSQRVKEIFVAQTLDRRNIWEIQTPQVFKKDLILEAYRRIKDKTATDDAYLVEKLGHKVVLCNGSYFNIKVTTPEDLVFAQAIAGEIY